MKDKQGVGSKIDKSKHPFSAPSEVLGVSLLKRTSDSLTLHWQRPLQSSQDVTGYEIQIFPKDDESHGRSSIMLSNVEVIFIVFVFIFLVHDGQ